MIDDSCKVPREDLDDGFNPCRRQVVENGELCQYAHMYDVMNERYDREEDTSYLNSVKRDKITSTTPVLLAGNNNTQIYANSTNGEGRVNMLPSAAFNNPENHTEASIPSAKAVADYVSSRYIPVDSTLIPPNSDLNDYITPGKYAVEGNSIVPSIINTPINLTKAFNIYVFPALTENYYIGQQLTTYDGSGTYYRFYSRSNKQWRPWALLYPTPSSTIHNVQSSSVEIDIPQGEKVEENYTNIQCSLNQVVVYQGGYTLEHDTDVIEVWPHVTKSDVGYEYRFGYHVYSLIDNPPKRTVVLNFLTITL